MSPSIFFITIIQEGGYPVCTTPISHDRLLHFQKEESAQGMSGQGEKLNNVKFEKWESLIELQFLEVIGINE